MEHDGPVIVDRRAPEPAWFAWPVQVVLAVVFVGLVLLQAALGQWSGAVLCLVVAVFFIQRATRSRVAWVGRRTRAR